MSCFEVDWRRDGVGISLAGGGGGGGAGGGGGGGGGAGWRVGGRNKLLGRYGNGYLETVEV